jgi:hypothetical protein
MRGIVIGLFALTTACSSGAGGTGGAGGATSTSATTSTTGAATGSSAATGGASASSTSSTGAGGSGCVAVSATDVIVATATTSDEFALTLPATSASHTDWSVPGNEALVLEVRSSQRGFIGHLVLHQGADGLDYGMELGALAAGETVSVRVSPLSASAATPSACVGPAVLTSATDLGAAGEGLRNAPILAWPVAKRFDDLPVVLGWSKAKKRYQLVYTNENGGTVALCGGGAKGIRAEIARWGRAADIEGIFDYGSTPKRWERCTGMTGYDVITPREEGLHPILYYGDGHNRLFESRGGYGQTCGTSSDARADGDLIGWNAQNPGVEQAKDAPFVIVVRPLPVSLDALGFDAHSGRREGLVDHDAPWLYRITAHELAREGKIDQTQALGMQQYLYADVHANDVGGSGDQVCSVLGVSGGFVLRAKLGSATFDGPQMTADYFGGQDDVKRIAIPLDQVYAAAQFTGLVFDAYDNDGIYFLDLGDVFIPRPHGDNGATIDSLHSGSESVRVYVDDDSSSCVNGMNAGGPGGAMPCAGSFYAMPL